MDVLTCGGTPIRPKRRTKAPSRIPKPDIEIGTVVTVIMIGRKTKSAVKESFCPMPRAMTKTAKKPKTWTMDDRMKVFRSTFFFLR